MNYLEMGLISLSVSFRNVSDEIRVTKITIGRKIKIDLCHQIQLPPLAATFSLRIGKSIIGFNCRSRAS